MDGEVTVATGIPAHPAPAGFWGVREPREHAAPDRGVLIAKARAVLGRRALPVLRAVFFDPAPRFDFTVPPPICASPHGEVEEDIERDSVSQSPIGPERCDA